LDVTMPKIKASSAPRVRRRTPIKLPTSPHGCFGADDTVRHHRGFGIRPICLVPKLALVHQFGTPPILERIPILRLGVAA
jgi:hypothetical protein